MERTYLSTADATEWHRWSGRNVQVSNDALGLASEPSIDYTNLRAEAVDISVDVDGNVLILKASGDIEWHDGEHGLAETVWSNGDGETIEEPRALCVAGDRIYVTDGATGTLVLISRRSGSVVGVIETRLDDPIDIIRSDRRIFILDAGTEDTAGRVLTLRRNGRVQTVVHGLVSPTDMTADSANLYIIEQQDGSPVLRIHDVGHLESPSIIPTSTTIDDLVIAGTDKRVVPVQVEVLTDQELVLIGRRAESDETALYHYTLGGDERVLTRRDDFALSCSKLLTGPREQDRRYPKYYAIAGEQDHVYIIDERQTYSRNPADGRYSAQAYRRFDSGAIDTSWGRLTLDFDDFPANTQVVTSYYGSNDRTAGGETEELDEISDEDAEKLRDADVVGLWDLLDHDTATLSTIVGDASTVRAESWQESALDKIDNDSWTVTNSANQQDILLENITGEYLHVKIELVGGVDSSPAIGGFRAYCPKQTYLEYLPEYFQRNGSGKFLERYLSIFQSEFVDIEEDIDSLTRYFDPEGVPSEYLSWLSDWLAIEYDAEWPASAKREFLSQAPTLFRLRGTKEGMRRILRLYLRHVEAPNTSWMAEWQKRRIESRRSDGEMTDHEVGARLRTIDDQATGYPDGHMLFFFEHLDLDGIESEATRRPYTMHMDGPRSFVTFVGPFVSDTHRRVTERVVASERPAHTHGRVVELRQELKLEGSSFLGINSTLTTREFVLGRSTLGGDTVLKDREPLA